MCARNMDPRTRHGFRGLSIQSLMRVSCAGRLRSRCCFEERKELVHLAKLNSGETLVSARKAKSAGARLTLLIVSLASGAMLYAAAPVGPKHDNIPTPAWLKDQPLISVGNWDSMPIFRRRVGGNSTWQEDDYRKRADRRNSYRN